MTGADDARLTIDDVAERLHVSKRQLETWLASDALRASDDRRFHHHVRHGRRRLWSETRFKALQLAIERESEPGGVLAASRSSTARAGGMSSAPCAGGRSQRLRRSLGLPATAATFDAAWDEARALEADMRATATRGNGRGDAVAIALKACLERKRKRPLGPSTIRIYKEIAARFGDRRLNDAPARDWRDWIDARQAGNLAATRERFVSTVAGFLAYARKHHELALAIDFDRDKEARNPRRRRRRHVDELQPDLIARLLACAHISLRAQLAVEWSTGARVSSVLYGVRVRDVLLAAGREQVTFTGTKNGDDVVAFLHPSASAILLEYAAWRGGLHDRDAPFFVTHRREPYAGNGRAGGGQNKTGFNAAKRRARREIFAEACATSRRLRAVGRRAEALAALLDARVDMRLLRRVTQHWFRHMLATRMRHDIRAAMEQGGWRDHRSVLGYVHDVSDARRALVAGFDDFSRSTSDGWRVGKA